MIIKLKNLRLKTIVGIYDWEQDIDRDIIINVKIESDDDKSMQTDAIEDAINYDDITTKIKDLVTNNRFKLIEKMVGEILDLIMQDQRIKSCELEIDKVGAVENLDSFSVTGMRERK